MPSKTISVTNGDGSTRTITIPDRSRFAGVRNISRNGKLDDSTTSIQVTVAGHANISGIYTGTTVAGTGWTQQGGNGTISVASFDATDGYTYLLEDGDADPQTLLNNGAGFTDRPWKALIPSGITITPVPETITVNRTAPVITSDRKGESRPLLSKLVGGAAAAYSLRDLNDKAGNNKVVEVRRFTDSQERKVLAKEVSNGVLEAFANESVKYMDSTGTSTASVYMNGLGYTVTSGSPFSADFSFSATGGFNNTEKYSFTGHGNSGSFSKNFYFGNAFNVTRIGTLAPTKTVTVEAYVKRTSGSSSDNLYIRPYATNTSNKIIVTGLVQDEWTLVKGTLIKDSATDNKNHIQVGGDTGVTFEVSNVKFYSENNDVTVSKWYDQSGNDMDAVQPTIGNQPHIARAGVLTDKGIEFDGTHPDGMYLEPPLLVPTIQNTTVIAVSTKRNGNNGYVGQFNRGLDRFYIRPNIVTIGNPATNFNQVVGTNDVKTIQTITATSGGLFTYFKDGTSVGTSNYTGDVGGGDSHIGSGNNGASSLDGIIHEIIVYHTDQSANRLAIEANINNQYDI